MEEKKLGFNISAIMQFIFDQEDHSNHSEITEIYSTDEETGDLSLISKQLSEVQDDDADARTTIKYDFIKLMIDYIGAIENNESMTLAQKLAFNALCSENFIKEC